MEVYVDDMLVKSAESIAHVSDLHEAFGTLKQYGMKLNPAKYAFGRKIYGLHGLKQRNIGQSRKDPGSIRDAIPEIHETAPANEWEASRPKPFHFSIHRQMPPIFQDLEDSLQMDQRM
jgi:hypothetical protein